MSNKEMNIYQRMLKATEEIGVVAKNLKVDVTKTNSYKAVSERDVLDAVKPIEIKYGIYSYPHEREVIDTMVLEQETYNGSIRKSLFMRLRTTYRFINIDNPTEYIDVTTYGDGVDTQDKATGKAMTYADKYALMKAYKISTGDDPDAEASQPLKAQKPKAEAKAPLPIIKQEAILELYNRTDINTMLKNLHKKSLAELTEAEADKMIAARKGK